MKESEKLLKMLFHLCDKLANMRLNSMARQKATMNRSEFEKVKQKERREEAEEDKLKK